MNAFKNTWQAALVTATLLGAGAAQAQTAVRFQDFPGPGNMLVRVAQAMGYCEAQGLRCETRTIPNAPLGLQTLLSGDIEVALVPAEVAASAVARKAPVKAIAAGFVTPSFFLMARADLQLPNEGKPYPAVVQDFKGLKVGVTARGAGPEFQVSDMLIDAGLKPSDVTFVAVGAPNTAFPALTNKQVDLVMSFTPMDGMCEVLKACRVIIDPRRGEGPKDVVAQNGGAGPLLARAEWIEKNPATVEAIRKALKSAEDFMHNPANFPKLEEILHRTFNIQLPQADRIASVSLKQGLAAYRSTLDFKAMQAVADYMHANRQLPEKVDMSVLK